MGKENWTIVALRETTGKNKEYAEWYSSKWGVPVEAYIDSIEE